ncbi:MAG: hypothetical protein ACRC33_26680 [Gemmataceae bacterium]
MKRFAILTALALCAAASARVPSSKAVLPRQPGVRGDSTVPYTTNGFTTLGVSGGVSPKVVASPELDTPGSPTTQKVYNLIFYGSRLQSSPAFNAASNREPNNLRGNQLKPIP